MRKKHPEHVNLERWLVSYADFITLLFAFFVIMYALAQADKAKFAAAAASIRAAFGAGPVGMVDLGGASGGNTPNPFETLESPGGRVHNLPAGKTNTAAEPDAELQQIRELLEETISLEVGSSDAAEHLRLDYDSQGLIVRLTTKNFFDEGSSVPQPDLRPILDRIARVLSKTPRLFRIEGYVDREEELTTPGLTHWRLSSDRATWVAQYWVKKFALDPRRIGVVGYSYYRPVANSNTPQNRAKNRRIEIVILNNRYQ
jgi:chemotaxis protein MotB